MPTFHVEGETVTVDEEDNSLVTALVKGAKNKLTIRGRRIHKIKNSKGKVLRDDKHPENVGKTEKGK